MNCKISVKSKTGLLYDRQSGFVKCSTFDMEYIIICFDDPSDHLKCLKCFYNRLFLLLRCLWRPAVYTLRQVIVLPLNDAAFPLRFGDIQVHSHSSEYIFRSRSLYTLKTTFIRLPVSSSQFRTVSTAISAARFSMSTMPALE